MSAIKAALQGLIDYAGLYPPAALDMRTAVRNYLGYRERKHAWMLGRFIVDMSRLDELREAVGEAPGDIRLSVLAAADADLSVIAGRRGDGFRIESVEIKCDTPLKIARICEHLPPDVECYFEIPIAQGCSHAPDAIAAVGARAKLRMGGVVADAFPTAQQAAERMCLLADREVAFKATAGLHHPVRSQHRLTYAADSPMGMMHGFINVLCAAAAIRFGGSRDDAVRVLEEEDASAFRVSDEEIGIHGFRWTTEQIREVREFFTSFGSCSFTEPIQDLEALGWPLA
jgi:hypothetical protein